MSASKVSQIQKQKNLVKIKYGHIKETEFVPTLQKVARIPMKSPKVAHRIMSMSKQLEPELTKSTELWVDMLKKHAKLDDKGNFVPQKDKPGTYQIQEDKLDDWKKASEEWADIEFEVPVTKLRLSDLDGANLSAKELADIEPLFNADL